MSIMTITGRGKRAVVNITGWTKQQIEGAILACEIDGYRVSL
jgi:hypothetical protein